MGRITLAIRTFESQQPNTPPITHIPMTVEIYKTNSSHRPPTSSGEALFYAGFDPQKPAVGAVDFSANTFANAFIIKVKAFSVKNKGKEIWAGFYTAYDGWGTLFKDGQTLLIELWYSWEKDAWQTTLGPNIIADSQVLGIGAQSGGPGADLPWPGNGKPWWQNLPVVRLPDLPKIPNPFDWVIWLIVGLAVLVIIILVVMKG